MLDLTISNYFYAQGVGFWDTWWTDFIYTFGLVPGWILFGLALISLFLASFTCYFKKFFNESLYVVLTLVIGSGLICHAGFKDHWGRPRPKQTIDFGGYAHYRPFWVMERSEMQLQHRSFCCGHCTMGFYFFVLYFIGKKRGLKKISLFGLGSALFLGCILSFVRIAQGGHFFSDTLVSAVVMYLTAYFLAWFLIPMSHIRKV